MEWKNFFEFKELLTPQLIKIIYVMGAIVTTLAGLFLLFRGTFIGFLTGSAYIIFGNLLWRMICETWILFFSMHESLVAIEHKKK